MNHSKPKFKEKYGNYINGEFVDPVGGQYFENTSPTNNQFIAKYPRSQKEDVEKAVDAANAAKVAWGNTSAAHRASILQKIADVIEENLNEFAAIDTYDNGKAIRVNRKCRYSLSCRSFQILCLCYKSGRRKCYRTQRKYTFINYKRAFRCSCSNYTLELSNAYARLESCPCTSFWELCSFKTRRANTKFSNFPYGENWSFITAWCFKCNPWFWS